MAPTSFLRRSSNLTCFFCLSAVSADSRSYRCPHCGCWNRFDANGEIMSDEPAMHDENLNASSFAKRASPNKDRLPSTYTKPPFCHTCQTNQMLLVNLLSNYLPPPQATPTIVSQHPDYAQRLEQLPAYRESLHVRYPPVCANCQPAVQDEIEQKNQMARTKALGGWLKESKGKERQRFASGSAKDRERLGLQLTIWQVRGVLWWTTLLSVLSAHAAAIRGYDFPHSLARVIPVLPVFCLFSFFYTAWDPTYYRFKKARVQGRDVRIKGKTRYVILQVLSWFSRFATSILLVLPRQSSSWDYLHISAYPLSPRVSTYCSLSLLVEFLVFSSSFTILHLQRPPSIRLIETTPLRGTPESSGHSARASPMPTAPLSNEPDLLASLTLSSKPLMSPTNPVFGRPSLVSQASPIKIDESPDEDAMDWTPTNLSPVKAKDVVDDHDGAWLRPQRFFPPEHPTGLESLFANTKLDDRNVHSAKPTSAAQRDFWNMKAIGLLIAAITIILIPLGSVVYHRWMKGWIQ
ncbi:Ima1 N-terminal domain-containing protein [Boletus edulis]|nr:Ima1 N-terminal domain-containing protein [Boletus edulis]